MPFDVNGMYIYPQGKKLCKECKEWLPSTLEFFYACGKYLSSRCKKCYNPWYIELRKQHPEWSRGDKERNRKRAQEWYRNNTERAKYRTRQWRIDNYDRKKDYDFNWRKNNKEQYRKSTQLGNMRRHTRKRNLPDTVNQSNVKFALNFFESRCPYCNNYFDSKYHLDHFIPLSSNDCPGAVAKNILPVCPKCNVSKNNADPVKWLCDKFGEDTMFILRRIYTYFDLVGNTDDRNI